MAPRLPFSPPDLGGRDPWWVLLYAVTLALQGLCGFLRTLVFLVPAGVVFAIAGILSLDQQVGNNPVSDLCLLIGFGPLVFSLLSLIRPVGAGSYWRTRVGGRAPSDRERLICDEVLEMLGERDPGMRVPRSWFVIDDLQVNGAVLGDTLMLSTGTLMDVALEPVLAHELGHLNAIDGRMTVALNRIALPANLFARVDRAIGERGGCLVGLFAIAGWICSGELALVLLRPFWDAWFRAREFKADAYAAHLGQAGALADMLEREALIDDQPIPFRFISGASHPSTEHRIQALHNLDRHQQGALR
jgi:hypothetical protein